MRYAILAVRITLATLSAVVLTAVAIVAAI